jgi:hypothetical protein
MELTKTQKEALENMTLSKGEAAMCKRNGIDPVVELASKRKDKEAEYVANNIKKNTFSVLNTSARDGDTSEYANPYSISVYGLDQKFPVTLYLDQWLTLQKEIAKVIEFGRTLPEKPAGWHPKKKPKNKKK